jgi:hypothetical protein
MSEGFFSRWSRRKQEAGQGQQEPTPGTRVAGVGIDTPALPQGLTRDDVLPGQHAQTEDRAQAGQQALPTLDDVRALTPQSDFQPFMQSGVGADVRNAAMKKLFADPHFNVMDGLDIYIDDYSQPDPMPAGMLRRMASAQFLGLVPREAPGRQADPVPTPALNPTSADGMEVVAQSPDSSAAADTQPHDNPDLQLQPDPAPADPQPGSGPR